MNDIKNVLDKSVEEAQKGAQSAKETIEIIGYDIEKLEKLDYIFLIQKEFVLTQEINYKVVPELKEKYLVYNVQEQVFEETTNNSFDVQAIKGNQVKEFFKK